MVPLTGLEPVLSSLRQILSLLCLPFHHSGATYPSPLLHMNIPQEG